MRRLGAHGPEISVVGFGAWEAGGEEWGPNTSEQQVIDAVRSALDAGINWVDTAEVYGSGTSEELVGRAVAGRDDVLIATKVGPAPWGTGFRPEQIAEACRGSMERLGVDRIDVYQLHWPDDSGVPIEETWGAMAQLVDDGLVRAIGVSNFDQPLIERCLSVRHVDSLQQNFSMVYLDDRDLIRWCGEQGIGVVAYGPLGFGLLTGAISAETRFDPADWRSGRREDDDLYDRLFAPGRIERSVAVAERVGEIADRLGVTTAQLAVAWVFHQPGVTAAIVGTRNPAHAKMAAAAGDNQLDETTLDELERILPLGPAFAEASPAAADADGR
jgi:aryl-alcohol dehydrogenase-like predicted oxidoreductase